MVEKTDQGAGYWRLPDGRPKFSALTDADRRVRKSLILSSAIASKNGGGLDKIL